MNRKISLTAFLLTITTLIFAQDQTPTIKNVFGMKKQTARERVLDSQNIVHPYRNGIQKRVSNRKLSEAKSASSFTHKLDSAVAEETFKNIFVYDDNGNNTLGQTYYWNFPGAWTLEENIETTFNSDNLPEEYTYSGWDGFEMTLQPVFRETYVYQEDGLYTESITYFWELDEWVSASQYTYAYDDQQNLTEFLILSWDEENEIFEPTSKETYVYNTSGGLIEFIVADWFGSWVDYYKEEYTLNAQDEPILVVTSEWSDDDEIWEFYLSIDFSYNAADLVTEELYSIWISEDEGFMPIGKIVREYDTFDQLISEETLLWDEMTSDWSGGFLETYEYDTAGNILVQALFIWDFLEDEYVIEMQDVTTYNLNVPVANIMAPMDYYEFYNSMALTSTISLFYEGQLGEEILVNLYYSAVDPTNVNDLTKNAISVFPNPFRETIRLSGSQELVHFTLYDLQGRVILQKQLNGDSEINTGDLPAGMYVYQIDGVNARQTGKLIRE